MGCHMVPSIPIPPSVAIALRLMVAEGYAPEDVVKNLPIFDASAADDGPVD
jgi:hypothetical protein